MNKKILLAIFVLVLIILGTIVYAPSAGEVIDKTKAKATEVSEDVKSWFKDQKEKAIELKIENLKLQLSKIQIENPAGTLPSNVQNQVTVITNQINYLQGLLAAHQQGNAENAKSGSEIKKLYGEGIQKMAEAKEKYPLQQGKRDTNAYKEDLKKRSDLVNDAINKFLEAYNKGR